jgi:hypothetical protein
MVDMARPESNVALHHYSTAPAHAIAVVIAVITDRVWTRHPSSRPFQCITIAKRPYCEASPSFFQGPSLASPLLSSLSQRLLLLIAPITTELPSVVSAPGL